MSIAQQAADREVLEALSTATDAELLKAFAAFTHRMHDNATAPKLAAHGAVLREHRDLVQAEILRRMA